MIFTSTLTVTTACFLSTFLISVVWQEIVRCKHTGNLCVFVTKTTCPLRLVPLYNDVIWVWKNQILNMVVKNETSSLSSVYFILKLNNLNTPLTATLDSNSNHITPQTLTWDS